MIWIKGLLSTVRYHFAYRSSGDFKSCAQQTRNGGRNNGFIVSGMEGYVGGVPCAILDISASGVRLLIPDQGLPSDQTTFDVTFKYESHGELISTETVGTLVRQTDLFFVLSYSVPQSNWEDTIRSLDFVDALTRSDLVF